MSDNNCYDNVYHNVLWESVCFTASDSVALSTKLDAFVLSVLPDSHFDYCDQNVCLSSLFSIDSVDCFFLFLFGIRLYINWVLTKWISWPDDKIVLLQSQNDLRGRFN